MKLKKLFKSTLICVGFFAANTSVAQMVGADVFLKGKYEEVGIGELGCYGSHGDAPVGYHPHGFTNLGFVADPGMTGWDTSSSSHYMGDYFLPGSPFEGWELQENGKICQAYGDASVISTGSGMPTCVGRNISYATIGSQVISTWQGVIDSITLTQITYLDTNDLYFTVKIILTNTATTPRDSIYYLRSLDPDNDETWAGGSFTTENIIEHQSTDTTVVSATGVLPFSYLALGTTDTNATCFSYSDWGLDISVDLHTCYNETYTPAVYAQGAHGAGGDDAIGLVVFVPHLATVDSAADSVARTTATTLHPANSASFTYFYAFSPDAVDSAIAHPSQPNTTTPPSLAIKNINTVADVKVYPNPSKDMINVTGLTAGDQLTLYDMVGRNMGQDWVAGGQRINSFSYNNVPSSAYLLTVSDANGNVKARVSVRKM